MDIETCIAFSAVGKTYPHETKPAIKGVTFAISRGEFVCFVGPSGCGKTTVLKLIAGLETQSEGNLVKPDQIAMAFQLGALFPWLTVGENVAFGLPEKGMSQEEIDRIVDRELRLMQMHAFKQKYPADLSGGQRQRVGIARALAVNPQVLLLDEPFSALDPKITAELHDDILKLWHEKGTTIIMVSHLIEEAVSLAQRVILMRDGHVVQNYPITLPYPRREQAAGFMHDVQTIRREFFAT